MRPDEHKRKKNEKYKKKHGISTSNSADGASKESEGAETKKTSNKHDSKTVKSKVKADSGASVDKDEPTPRRLPDNWERYEEEDSEEDERFMPEMRGEDFNKLIAESGGLSSRFRFKDEEDWADAAGDADKPSQHVSLDFDNLALALDCIPLCERLGLSKDLFTENQVEEMTRNANECETKYSSSFQTLISDKDSIDAKKMHGKGNDETHNDAKQDNVSISNFHNESLSVTNTDGLKKDVTKNMKENVIDAKKPEQTTEKAAASVNNSSLDIVKTTETATDNKVNGEVKKSAPDISSLEDDLDSLLSFDLPTSDTVADKSKPVKSKPVQSVPVVVQKPVSGKKVTSDNTEDWLDELLED